MAHIRKGDHRAFSILVRRHTAMFYAVAYRSCGDKDIAEDAVQDAFLKLWAKPQKWDADNGAKFTTWFYRIVVNATKDRLRKQKTTQDDNALDHIPDGVALQDEALEHANRSRALENAIQSLPDKQKYALNLCFYEGLSNKEAAKVLGVGVKALESLLMRGKKTLRDTLLRQNMMEKEKEYETG